MKCAKVAIIQQPSYKERYSDDISKMKVVFCHVYSLPRRSFIIMVPSLNCQNGVAHARNCFRGIIHVHQIAAYMYDVTNFTVIISELHVWSNSSYRLPKFVQNMSITT